MKRIICIGNRYLPEDAAGFAVLGSLLKMKLPDDIEVIDGGLAGLDLLRFIEGAERVVFVDSVSGFDTDGSVVHLDAAEVADLANQRFDHSSGLPYLLRVLPDACQGSIPQIVVLGIEGVPDEQTVKKASTLALKIAMAGKTETERLNEKAARPT